MKLLIAILSAGLVACGGSSASGTCQATPCGSGSSRAYKLCQSKDDATITYEFGSKSCSYAATDAAQATLCGGELEAYCGNVGLE